MSTTASGGRHARTRDKRDLRSPVLVAFVAAGEFVAALAATSSVAAALALIFGVLAVTAAVLWPTLLMSAAFPASFGVHRVGPSVVDMSIADAVGFFGAVAALPSVPWRARAFRKVLGVTAGYCAVVAVAVVLHPSVAGAVEVVHRFVMVMGAVCIGAAVVHRGKVTVALRAMTVAACAVAIAAILDTLSNGLRPAYAFEMQKNASGSLLVTSLVVILFGRRHLRLPTWAFAGAVVVIMAGITATQSRGSGLALASVLLIFGVRSLWEQRNRRVWRFAPLVLLLLVAVGFAMVASFQREAAQHTGANYKFGSVGSRTITYTTVWDDVIKPQPLLGFGPKWFRQPGAPAGEPHNLILDELSSDGLVGLLAFIVLLWTCLRVCRSTSSVLGEMAWYVLVARLIADMFDLFWVAGPNTLPFLIFGLAVGAAALEENPAAAPGAARTAVPVS